MALVFSLTNENRHSSYPVCDEYETCSLHVLLGADESLLLYSDLMTLTDCEQVEYGSHRLDDVLPRSCCQHTGAVGSPGEM